MDKRTVIKMALDWETPPYMCPGISTLPSHRLRSSNSIMLGKDLEEVVQNHIVNVGYDIYFYHEVGKTCVQDHFGVIWDRSIDKDIGVVKGQVLGTTHLKRIHLSRPGRCICF